MPLLTADGSHRSSLLPRRRARQHWAGKLCHRQSRSGGADQGGGQGVGPLWRALQLPDLWLHQHTVRLLLAYSWRMPLRPTSGSVLLPQAFALPACGYAIKLPACRLLDALHATAASPCQSADKASCLDPAPACPLLLTMLHASTPRPPAHSCYAAGWCRARRRGPPSKWMGRRWRWASPRQACSTGASCRLLLRQLKWRVDVPHTLGHASSSCVAGRPTTECRCPPTCCACSAERGCLSTVQYPTHHTALQADGATAFTKQADHATPDASHPPCAALSVGRRRGGIHEATDCAGAHRGGGRGGWRHADAGEPLCLLHQRAVDRSHRRRLAVRSRWPL